MAIDTTQAAAPYSGPVDPFKDPTFRHGEVETDLDRRFLAGDIVARITESDGESPARIIDANENWHVDVWLQLHGSLLPMICGSLAFRLIAENIGPPIKPITSRTGIARLANERRFPVLAARCKRYRSSRTVPRYVPRSRKPPGLLFGVPM